MKARTWLARDEKNDLEDFEFLLTLPIAAPSPYLLRLQERSTDVKNSTQAWATVMASTTYPSCTRRESFLCLDMFAPFDIKDYQWVVQQGRLLLSPAQGLTLEKPLRMALSRKTLMFWSRTSPWPTDKTSWLKLKAGSTLDVDWPYLSSSTSPREAPGEKRLSWQKPSLANSTLSSIMQVRPARRIGRASGCLSQGLRMVL